MKKTKIIISLDVEFSTHRDDMGVFGKFGHEFFGIPKISEILDKYNFKAVFFWDVFSNKHEYLHSFINLGKSLQNFGHDIQLHTHPEGIYGKNHDLLNKYSLDDQIKIIGEGKRIFKEWFGVDPLAHRAGDWAANKDTLEALQVNGINVDSSYFLAWDKCNLDAVFKEANKVQKYNNVFEIPPAIFQCVSFGGFSKTRLLSTDGNSLFEVMHVLRQMKEAGIPVITLVYHSFSFLSWDTDRKQYKVACNRLDKFYQLMKLIYESNDFEVVTMTDVIKLPFLDLNSPSLITKTNLYHTALRLADRLIDKAYCKSF